MARLSNKLFEIYELHCAGMAKVEIEEVLNLPLSIIHDAINIFEQENDEYRTPYWNEHTIENYH